MAENTNGKESFNDYKEDLKVFDDLLKMSDEELKRQIDIATELFEKRDGKTPEIRELEAYFAEMDKKEVISGIERIQRIEKERRYNEIISSPEYQKQKDWIEKNVQSELFADEYEKHTIFLKVREPLKVAEEVIKEARSKMADKLKVAKVPLKEAKANDRKAKAKIEKELSELDKYFEEYTKKPYLSEEDRIEYEEKKKSQKELLDAKENFPSKDVIDAKANIEEILQNSEESKRIINAKNQIKFMTDRNNWGQIRLMSKEDLIDRINAKETNEPTKVEPTVPEQTPTQNVGEAPVVSNETPESEEELGEDENEEGEPKDLTDPKRSIWERFKGLFTKRFAKNKEKAKVRKSKRQKMTRAIRKEKQNKIYNKYIENYKAKYKAEPGWLYKKMAWLAPNFFPQVRNVIEYREPINPEDFKNTQAQGLAEKVEASKMLGENSLDKTPKYTEKMNVGQVLDLKDDLKIIDEYYKQGSNPVVKVNTDYSDDYSDEPEKVEAVIIVNTDYQAPEPESAEQQEQAISARQSTVEKFKKQRKAQDLKKPEIATLGIRHKSKEPKLDLGSVMAGANKAAVAKIVEARLETRRFREEIAEQARQTQDSNESQTVAKGREARGEAPNPTTPSHGDDAR